MNEEYILIAGLPESGKSTFIGALSYEELRIMKNTFLRLELRIKDCELRIKCVSLPRK